MDSAASSANSGMRRVELIAVGREILRGRVLDTNSNWLAKALTGLGGEVSRICVVDDVPQEIGRELHAAMQHGAGVIVTMGGLGPTFDDCTIASIAQAVDLPLVKHETAYACIAETYRRLHAEGAIAHQAMLPSREKMALLPQGAEMLPNPTGSAPGMLLRWQQHLIIALPGPPGEMRPMFQASVAPLLQARWAGRHRVEVQVQTDVADESLLNPLFGQVMAMVPGSYLKADPKGFGPEVQLAVYITAEAAVRRQRAPSSTKREISSRMAWRPWGMGWRQRSERGGNGIEAEHVVMVPKAHRLTVNNQVMLHLLGLGAQPIILRNADIELGARFGVTHLVLAQGGDGVLDSLASCCHFTQQGIQAVAITSRLGGNLFQYLAFDSRQGVAGLGGGVSSAISLFQAIEIEAATHRIDFVH